MKKLIEIIDTATLTIKLYSYLVQFNTTLLIYLATQIHRYTQKEENETKGKKTPIMSVHSVIAPKVKSKGSLLFAFLVLVFKHALVLILRHLYTKIIYVAPVLFLVWKVKICAVTIR